MLIIDDTNFRDHAKRSEDAGRTTGWSGAVDPAGGPFSATRFRDKYKVIDRSAWSNLIKEGVGGFVSDLHRRRRVRVKNQGSKPLCWMYGSTSAMELARLAQGHQHVELCPESAAGPVTNWRLTGGYASWGLEQLRDEGACAQAYCTNPDGFSESMFQAGWRENRKCFRILEWVECETFEEVMTLALLRIPMAVGLDWWRHLVCFCDPVEYETGKFGIKFLNSWGPDYGEGGFGILAESRAQPSGAFAPTAAHSCDWTPENN